MPLRFDSMPVANGNVIQFTYSEALHPVDLPPLDAFQVRVDGVLVPVIHVAAIFKDVMLTLGTAVTDGQTVAISYTDPTPGNDAYAIQTEAGEDAESFSYDRIPNQTNEIMPSVALSVDDAMLTAGQTTLVTLTFSEPPIGYFEVGSEFTAQDIVATNGVLSSFTRTADARVFTTVFTPTGDGPCEVAVATGSYRDGVGVVGQGGSVTFSADISPPSVTLTVDDALLAAQEQGIVTFTFSEPPVGFEFSDIGALKGVLGNFSATADPRVFTVVYTPTEAGRGWVGFVWDNDYTDAAGNVGSPSDLRIDNEFTAPVSSVRVAGEGVLAAGETIEVEFAFNERPFGFGQDDVLAPNGVLSDLSATDDPLRYTATYRATQGGPVQIEILGGDYVDAAGNPGWGSTTLALGATAPSIIIRIDDSTLRSGQAAQVSFRFVSDPVGFTAADVVTVNGVLSDFTQAGQPRAYTAVFTPTGSGPASLAVSAGSYADGDGHEGRGATVHLSADLVAPTVTVRTVSDDPAPGEATQLTFAFSEAPTNFTATDVTATNGTVSGLTSTDDPRIYRATFTAGHVGPASVSVTAGGYADAFGNPGHAGSMSLSVEEPAPPPPPPPAPNTPSDGPDIIRIPDSGGVVSAGAGDDSVLGGAANDWMNGNVGRDTITAGAGADTVLGGRDDDWLHGNAADDMVFGDLGDDVVHGGKGADFVQGNVGNDSVFGDDGDDRVYGGQGDDVLSGGAGADWLFGDLGNDVIFGGAGSDRFCFTAGVTGLDVIADFSHADGDVLWISTALANSFEELAAHITASAAGDAVITLGAQTIVLAGVAPSGLAASDFLFG